MGVSIRSFLWAGVLLDGALLFGCNAPPPESEFGADTGIDSGLDAADTAMWPDGDDVSEDETGDFDGSVLDTSPEGSVSPITRLELWVSAATVTAGETVSTQCVAFDADGVARSTALWNPLQQQAAPDGTLAVWEGEAVLTQAGAWTFSCEITVDERPFRATAMVHVAAGPVAQRLPRIPMERAIAGLEFEAACDAADIWGNRVTDSDVLPLWDIVDAVTPLGGGRWRIERTGTYQASCPNDDGTVSEARALTVVMAGPVAMNASYSPFPGRPFAQGDFVRPRPTFVDAYGNVGTLDDVGGTLSTVTEPPVPEFPGGFRFDNDGRYRMTLRWVGPDGREFEGTAPDILVNSFGPAVTCVSPAHGDALRVSDGTVVDLTLQHSDWFGVATVWAGPDAVPLDDGDIVRWPWRMTHGVNLVSLGARDTLQQSTATYCLTYAAPDFVPESSFVPHAVGLRLGTGPDDLLARLAPLLAPGVPSPEPPDAPFVTCAPVASAPGEGSTAEGSTASAGSGEGSAGTPVLADPVCEAWEGQLAESSAALAVVSLQVQGGRLGWALHWPELLATTGSGDLLRIVDPTWFCPLDVRATAGQVEVVEAAPCTFAVGSAMWNGLPWAVDATWLAAWWPSEAWAATPGWNAALAQALRDLDPVGWSTQERTTVSDPRPRVFALERRLDAVGVDAHGVWFDWAVRVSGERTAAYPIPGIPARSERNEAWVEPGDSLLMGDGFLWASSVAFWRAGLESIWWLDMVRTIDSTEAALAAFLLTDIGLEFVRMNGWSVAGEELRFHAVDVVPPDLTAVFGADYEGRGSVTYKTRLTVRDGAWVPDGFRRDPIYISSSNFPLGVGNIAELSRAFRYVDPAVRPWMFERHLPDAPRPALLGSVPASAWRATLVDGALEWRDGAARIRLRWTGPPP